MTSVKYSLKGDRHVEYTFTTSHIPAGDGKRLLDVGPGARAKLGKWAMGQRGWNVLAVDIHEDIKIPGIAWIKGDLNNLEFDPDYFSLILNVSSIEHFGIPGRYGIGKLDEDADLRAMRRMREWLAEDGAMIVTTPVGNKETILAPYHRIYDNERLLKLFDGYIVKVQKFWNKQGGNNNEFVACSADEALSAVPTLDPHHYYAIGGFVLQKGYK